MAAPPVLPPEVDATDMWDLVRLISAEVAQIVEEGAEPGSEKAEEARYLAAPSEKLRELLAVHVGIQENERALLLTKLSLVTERKLFLDKLRAVEKLLVERGDDGDEFAKEVEEVLFTGSSEFSLAKT